MSKRFKVTILHIFDYYITRYARAGPHGISRRLVPLISKVASEFRGIDIRFEIVQTSFFSLLFDLVLHTTLRIQSKYRRIRVWAIIAFIVLLSFRLRYTMLYRRIIRILRKACNQKDYIVIQVHTPLSAYILLNVLSRCERSVKEYYRKKIRIVYSNHAPGSPTLYWIRQLTPLYVYVKKLVLLLIRIELAIFKLFNLFIFPSKATGLLWLNDLMRLGINLGTLRHTSKYAYIVYNGVKVRYKQKGLIRSKLGIGQNVIVIGSVGKLIYDKGVDVLVKALGKIINTYNYKNVKLIIRGSGPEESNLRELVRRLNIENYVIFLKYVFDINDLYEDIDIFVAPQRRAAFDLVVLEALGHGLPIVASDIHANREALNGAAVFFRSENYDELADKIYMLIANSALRYELSRRAIRLFLKRYTPISMARNYIKAYLDMLGLQDYEYKITLSDLLEVMKARDNV